MNRLKPSEVFFMPRTLQLHPWTFPKDEDVCLYWLLSPYRTTEGDWILTAVFKKKNGQLVEIRFSMGTLPLLRFGQYYRNGFIIPGQTEGKQGTLGLKDATNGRACISYTIPPDLYSMYHQNRYGTRREVWRFEIRGINYYIPCLEIVRSYLTHSTTLANYLLYPDGLERLIEKRNTYSDTLEIVLSEKWPGNLTSEEAITHLSWLLYDSGARNFWESIYRDLYSRAAKVYPSNPINGLKGGIPIELELPFENHRWTFRGLTRGRDVVILEITEISGLLMPFKEIKFSHPSFKTTENTNSGSTEKDERSKHGEAMILDGGPARPTASGSISVPPTMFKFDSLPRLGKQYHKTYSLYTHTTDDKKSGSNEISGLNTIVSTARIYPGSENKPLELQGIEIDFVEQGRGLKEFLTAIDFLKIRLPNFLIYTQIVLLPNVGAFAKCDDGSRRSCAVVRIKREACPTIFLIEISRPDGWQVSTLLIFSKKNGKMDKMVQSQLENLVHNNGHWDLSIIESINDVKVKRMKHVSGQRPQRWASRLVENILS